MITPLFGGARRTETEDQLLSVDLDAVNNESLTDVLRILVAHTKDLRRKVKALEQKVSQ